MPKEELERLKQKSLKNENEAYHNLIMSDKGRSANPVEAMLKYMGINYRLTEKKLSRQLDEINREFDINYRTVTLSSDWYKNSMLPLLITQDGVNKIVLPDYRGRCYIYDKGKKTKIKSSEGISKSALCFYKGFGNGKISKLQLFKYMLKTVPGSHYIVIALAAVLMTGFSTVMPQTQYYLFNNIVPTGTKGDVAPVACLLTGIAVISFVIYMFKSVIGNNIPLTASANIQGATASRLLRLKTSFFTTQKSGKLSCAITSLSSASNIFSGERIGDFLGIIMSVIYAYQIAILTPQFMPFVVFAFFVIVVMSLVNAFLSDRQSREFSRKINDMSGFVYELFSGIESIKLNDSESVMFKRWSEYYREGMSAYKKPFFTKHFKSIYSLAVSLFTVLLMAEGINSDINGAVYITFMSLFGLFIGAVGGISSVFDSITAFNSAYDRLKYFFNSETEETTNKASVENIEGNIEFQNVSFRYSGSDVDVINDMSFSIKKGQKLGITGKSGCGKSTLMRLLLGFDKPAKGRIFVDNMDLNEINITDYRKQLGVVLQSSKLIPSDIYSNITLTAPDSTYDDVNKVVEIVGLKEDIEKMPMGLHTFVSDDNLTISGGQKQRILIARAIIGKPAMLILDEATNALDNITQQAITKYTDNADTTAVIVAHRLSTIKNCDSIIVLDKGTVAEQGSYDELINKKGIFYELVKNQMNS